MKGHAVIVLQDEKGRTLFIKRSMKKNTLPGKWAFPSGTIKEGENIFETIIREASEELDIKVQPISIFAKTVLTEFSAHLYFVLCRIDKDEPRIKEPDEIDKIDWMTFCEFFSKFSDHEIGHGLVWLRKNPQLWRTL